MIHKTGITILKSDERRQTVMLRPFRIKLVGELPAGYKHTDYIEDAWEEKRLANASALYVGIGRTHVWFYWRRRPMLSAGWSGKWIEFRDTQAEHIAAEGARA